MAAKKKISLAGDLAQSLETSKANLNPTFLEFLQSPDYCGPYMQVALSPTILDIAQISDGLRPTHLDDDGLEAVFRCGRLDFLADGTKPKIISLSAGRRGGKTSNLLAPKCVHAAWTVPVPDLKKGERARAAIVAPILDQATAALNYCKGIIEGSPVLRAAVIKSNTKEIVLRRPDGNLVEIVVGAANHGGIVGRSRTLVFAGLDEAQFFRTEGADVNDKDIFDAFMGTLRFVDGAQCWLVSTPWIEGDGLMEKFTEEYWGSPGGTILVASRVSSYQLRGIVDDGSVRLDTDDDDTYEREVLAVPLPKGTSNFFDGKALLESLQVLPPETIPEDLGAGADVAYERDCSALVLAARYPGGIFVPLQVEERRPNRQDVKSASKTNRELAEIAVSRGIEGIMADAHCRPFVREHFEEVGAHFVDAPAGNSGKFNTYAALKRVIADKRFILGGLEPTIAKYLIAQLRQTVAKPMEAGGYKIITPRTKTAMSSARDGDSSGSHGDVVSALVLAMWTVGSNLRESEWLKPKAPEMGRYTDFAPSRPQGGSRGSGMNLDYLKRNSAGISLKHSR